VRCAVGLRKRTVGIPPQPVGFVAHRGVVQILGTDHNSVTKPILPIVGQLVVGVDPGRRDLVTAWSGKFSGGLYDLGSLGRVASFKMSTKQFLMETGRLQYLREQLRRVRRILVQTGDGSDTCSLASFLRTTEKPPANPSLLGSTKARIRAELSVLPVRLQHNSKHNQSRKKYLASIKRKRALARLAASICGHQRQFPQIGPHKVAPRSRTIVAYGAADCCSTGFGYAPTPQTELRKAVHDHGAHMVVIDEYNTSKVCSRCDEYLDSDVMATNPLRRNGKKVLKKNGHVEMRRRAVWGVKRCRNGCLFDGGPGYTNRDTNASANMVKVQLQLATGGRVGKLKK